ncbi:MULTISPECIES: sel1 repeat family protein [unclassified Bradyrhizobium]|uniref:sel1 repeat family protein n=1 Tax=unclassified Bradyrhizobium TaxID=2631580 RepID=UPI001BACEC73|nr:MULTISPECIES: sel1 repeat family protein [unclassified Bradyrhizobium]MBR1309806.1 sel1 repeat family protein [Bradyrhizobium sp. AUGA SZCCT0051]MBR1339947.1 sel1 repeat family protein [Bradyrhizobium sp. AUGA SZCCT0105]MBR1354554.1 sel1 repeat family protein [Bradyrhizobium sp. AUGA SZCCT0045]
MSRRTLSVFTIALAVALAVISFKSSQASAADSAKVIGELEASRPDWLPKLETCPADVMPTRETTLSFSIARCSASLDRCVDRCHAGDASDCYSAALVIQKAGSERLSQALFLRACALGFVSGCTNRAAGMDSGQGSSCAIRTYQLGCDRKDPWACTMTGFHLIRGIGIERDLDRARKALSQSCYLGEDDEACIAGRALLKEIDH